VIKILIALAVVCLLEGVAIYCVIEGMARLKEQAKASAAAAAVAERELAGAQTLLRKQKTAEEDAKNEQQELQNSPNAGLAGRANGLFGS